MRREILLVMIFLSLGGLLWQCGGDEPGLGPGAEPEPSTWSDKIVLATAAIDIDTQDTTEQPASGGYFTREWRTSGALASHYKFSVTFKPGIPAGIEPKPMKLGAIDPITLQDDRTVLFNFKEVEINVNSPTDGLIGGQEPQLKVPLSLRNCNPQPGPDPNQPLDHNGIALQKWTGDPHVLPIPAVSYNCEVWGDFTHAFAQTYSGNIEVNYLGAPKSCSTDDDCYTPYSCVNHMCRFDPKPALNKIVFVTSDYWWGGLGGLQGADNKCNELWIKANPTETSRHFAALLSGATLSDGKLVNEIPALSRIADPPRGAQWVLWDTKKPETGTLVSTGKEQLEIFGPVAPIKVDEKGATLTGNFVVWTGTRPDLRLDDTHNQCAPNFGGETWTAGAFNTWEGTVGHADKIGAEWVQADKTACNGYSNRLYCFESP